MKLPEAHILMCMHGSTTLQGSYKAQLRLCEELGVTRG